MLNNEVLDGGGLTIHQLFVMSPSNSWSLHKFSDVCFYIFHPHPYDIIDFLQIPFQSLIFTHSPSHEKGRCASMTFKFNFDSMINFVVNINSGLLLYFAGCTLLSWLMLIAFSFRKAKLVSDAYSKYFAVIFVKDYGTAYWFVLLDFGGELLWIDFNGRWTVLFEFEEKLIPLPLPVF